MTEDQKGWGNVIASLVGGILVCVGLLWGINTLAGKTAEATKNPDNTIVTSGGMHVKMGRVTAELPQTGISVGSGAYINVPITDAAKELSKLMVEAGVQDTSILNGNLTVCLATVVAYKTELNGLVSTKIAQECRNFTPGMMAGTINTFAEEYTVKAVELYKSQYTFINKR